MLKVKDIIYLFFLLSVALHQGCVIQNDNIIERVDYGNGFSFKWYTFIGDVSNNQRVTHLIHDSEGNIIILGTSDSHLNSCYGQSIIPYEENRQGLLIKLNSDGVMLWHTFFPESERNKSYERTKIVIDESDNIYLLGTYSEGFSNLEEDSVYDFNGEKDVYAIKFNSGGVLQWHTFLGGESDDFHIDFGVDQKGHIFILGTSFGLWNEIYGLPVENLEEGSLQKGLPFIAKLDVNGELIRYLFQTDSLPFIKGLSICVGNDGFIYFSIRTSLGTKYSSYFLRKIPDSLEATYQLSRYYPKLKHLNNGDFLSNYRPGEGDYRGPDEKEHVFTKLDPELNEIWKVYLNEDEDIPEDEAGFVVGDVKFDRNGNVFFSATSIGRMMNKFIDFPVISPLSKIPEKGTKISGSRKILVKLDNAGGIEWYSYFGDPIIFSSVPLLTISGSESFYIVENNRNHVWPDIYGKPKQLYTGLDSIRKADNFSILLAKFHNNPEFPKIRIYEEVYKKTKLFKKKTYIKLDYSFYLPSNYDQNEYNYILYKFDKDNKNWESIERYNIIGKYFYTDNHVYQNDFNHYKIAAIDKKGDVISESRIVSIYPPNPYPHSDKEG